MIGASPNVSLTIDTEFPEDYEDEQVAGQKAQATLTPTRVQTLIVPEIGDTLAGNLGLRSVDELRQRVQEELTRANERLRREALESQIMEQLLAEADIEVSPAYVGAVAGALMDGTRKRAGASFQAALEDAGLTEDDLFQAEAERTEGLLKRMLILEEIARQQEIEVADEDLQAEVARVAEAEGLDVEEAAQIAATEAQRRSLRRELFDRKVYDYLIAHASITDVPFELFVSELRQKSAERAAAAAQAQAAAQADAPSDGPEAADETPAEPDEPEAAEAPAAPADDQAEKVDQ